MSSSTGKEAVRLCEHIVRQAFGPVVCRVASTLLNRGRLAVFSITRLSDVPTQSTLAALIILVQHNLVATNGASVKGTGNEEMYEFDVGECLMRLRLGRILANTQERLGPAAVDVVKQVVVSGKLTVPEILQACGAEYDGARTTAVNEATISLTRGSFLQPTSPELHILLSDQVRDRIALKRRQRRDTGQVMLSANQLAEVEAESNYEVLMERDEQRNLHRILEKTEKRRKKKKGKDVEEFDYHLKPNIHLRVNFDRFGVLMRDELIIKAAEDRWNKGAAEVVRAVLAASLQDHSVLSDSRTHNEVGVTEIVDRLPPSTHQLLVAGMAGSGSKSVPEIVSQYLSVLAGEDQMVGNGGAFLSRNTMADPGYMVEVESICTRLRASLLTELVRERLGVKAARVLAVVAKASKAGETTVRDCAMIPLRDARFFLSELQKLSLVETQEVPKSSGKSRTGLTAQGEYHLWSVNLPRVYNLLLVSVYKTLGNILQRKAGEMEKRKQVLAREERAVAQGGRELLQGKDQEDLAELDDVLRKLTLAEARSEMVVFILRDLPGWPGQKV